MYGMKTIPKTALNEWVQRLRRRFRVVGPKPGLGSAMPRRRIAVDQATGLADLPDDVIRLVLRWCSASTLSRVRVNRRFTAAV